jgi:hypothetical protein
MVQPPKNTWEYMIEPLGDWCFCDPDIVKKLNTLGALGWELVGQHEIFHMDGVLFRRQT